MKKGFHSYIRSLHRDLGFLTIGLVVFFSLSGIVLIYRDTDFMKREVMVEKSLPKDLSGSDLSSELKLKNMKVISEDSMTVVFTNGTYSKSTGIVSYTSSEMMFPLNKLISLHKSISQNPTHWVVVLFGVILLFLALSSFWMFKSDTKQFKRGISFAIVGIVLSILLLFV